MPRSFWAITVTVLEYFNRHQLLQSPSPRSSTICISTAIHPQTYCANSSNCGLNTRRSTLSPRPTYSLQCLVQPVISNLVIWFPRVSQSRKPATTSKNYTTWEPGNLCPISRKPLKFVWYGNPRNQRKPKKPTKNYRLFLLPSLLKLFL